MVNTTMQRATDNDESPAPLPVNQRTRNRQGSVLVLTPAASRELEMAIFKMRQKITITTAAWNNALAEVFALGYAQKKAKKTQLGEVVRSDSVDEGPGLSAPGLTAASMVPQPFSSMRPASPTTTNKSALPPTTTASGTSSNEASATATRTASYGSLAPVAASAMEQQQRGASTDNGNSETLRDASQGAGGPVGSADGEKDGGWEHNLMKKLTQLLPTNAQSPRKVMVRLQEWA